MRVFRPEGTTVNGPGRKSGVRIIDQAVKAPAGATEAPEPITSHQLILAPKKFAQERQNLNVCSAEDAEPSTDISISVCGELTVCHCVVSIHFLKQPIFLSIIRLSDLSSLRPLRLRGESSYE